MTDAGGDLGQDSTKGLESVVDVAIAAGYTRVPADEPDAWVETLATASIEAEPW